jgi:hypothetical protein
MRSTTAIFCAFWARGVGTDWVGMGRRITLDGRYPLFFGFQARFRFLLWVFGVAGVGRQVGGNDMCIFLSLACMLLGG